MSEAMIYHVEKRDEEWIVIKEGGKRASFTAETKKDAVDWATNFAQKKDFVRLILHKADGSVQSERTFGEPAQEGGGKLKLTQADKVDDYNLSLYVALARKGVSYKLFEQISKYTGLTQEDWSSIMDVSRRTIQRIKSSRGTFDKSESDMIIRLKLLYDTGQDTFNSMERFVQWLDTKNRSLGEVKPKTLLDTTFGIEMIEDELLRLRK